MLPKVLNNGGPSHRMPDVARLPARQGRPWWHLVRALSVCYLVILLIMSFWEDTLIFFPSVYPQGSWSPARLNLEDAWFNAPDGTRLHGWYVPHPKPRAIVLFAHGNAGNLSDRASIVEELVDRVGVSVMIFDYRGYGRSSGSPSESGVLADARAARAWLAKRTGATESQIVLMGESLGGGVMVDLAASDDARALVLLNTFSSLPDVAAFHYPWLPVKWMMRTRLDSLAKIGNYRGPLLQIHGDADTIVPISLAERLFAEANEPKRFVTIRGGDHNDVLAPAVYAAIDQFLAQDLPAAPPEVADQL
jgi:uncharacterized protein